MQQSETLEADSVVVLKSGFHFQHENDISAEHVRYLLILNQNKDHCLSIYLSVRPSVLLSNYESPGRSASNLV
jgi:hypothetical protein